ncbi:MAG: pyrroline-5-carboxylate reductase [Eggerthellaceae bacterium]|nr:pyrroline-5-carboxylate reductase [Eggerthellaceae bacterium]
MKIGFIGAGNMASAIMGGIIESGLVDASSVFASNPSREKLDELSSRLGITPADSNSEIVRTCDVVVLAVKPAVLESVIAEVATVDSNPLYISIAAGKSIEWIEASFAHARALEGNLNLFERIEGAVRPVRLVRCMPNTPALVGQGMSGLCANASATEEDMCIALDIFGSCGRALPMSEQMVDVIGVVAGCTPAFTFLFIEALADAAVAEGMSRADAYQVVSQAVMGSAQLARDTAKHPGQLKDMVTSPAGTTIEGVQALEEDGFRAAAMHAVRRAMEKTRKL